MRERDESDRIEFGLKRDHCTIENRAGGAHQGAEHGAMRGSLMVSMVPGMLDRLRLSQSADGKDAKHQKDRYKFECGVVHQNMKNMTDCDPLEC